MSPCGSRPRRPKQRYAALVAVASSTVVGLDFDGTLAPIVDDPDDRPHPPRCARRAAGPGRGRPRRRGDHRPPGAQGARARRARRGGPADRRHRARAVRLRAVRLRALELDPAPRRLAAPAAGAVRLPARPAAACCATPTPPTPSSRTRAWRSPSTRAGSTTRPTAYDRLQPRLRDLAERYGLVEEPGRNVIEVRSPGMDKGVVVRNLAKEVEAQRLPVRRRRPRRRRGLRGGHRAPQGGHADPPGLLGLTGGERPARARPTSSSPAPTASSTSSAASPRDARAG